jgi:hypothetical protein
MTGVGTKLQSHREPKQLEFFVRKRYKPIAPLITPTVVKQFWRRVTVAGPHECWIVSGTRNADYLRICEIVAHRLSFVLHHGWDPIDFLLMHTCDNCRCANPLHLVPGTFDTNAADKVRKGRSRINKIRPCPYRNPGAY